jgi:hypothetical protein
MKEEAGALEDDARAFIVPDDRTTSIAVLISAPIAFASATFSSDTGVSVIALLLLLVAVCAMLRRES